MKRASVFLFVGFLGLVFLAASMFWMPKAGDQPPGAVNTVSTPV